MSDPFSDLYLSTWTAVEQPRMNNYLNSTDLQKSICNPLFTVSRKNAQSKLPADAYGTLNMTGREQNKGGSEAL